MDIKLPFLEIKPKFFEVHRHRDYKKISGTGHVIDGVIFPDGTTVIHWRSKYGSTCVFKSYNHFRKIHHSGHKGRIIWLEEFKEKNHGKTFSFFGRRRRGKTSLPESNTGTESPESTLESDKSITKT